MFARFLIVMVPTTLLGCASVPAPTSVVTVAAVNERPEQFDGRQIAIRGYLCGVMGLKLLETRELCEQYEWLYSPDVSIHVYDASEDASLHLSKCPNHDVLLVGTFYTIDGVGEMRVRYPNIRDVQSVTRAGEADPCWVAGFQHTQMSLLTALEECRNERFDKTYRYRCQNHDLKLLEGLSIERLESVLGEPEGREGGIVRWHFYDPSENIPYPQPTLECIVDTNGRCLSVRWVWDKGASPN